MGIHLGSTPVSVYTGGVIVKNSGQYVWEKYEIPPICLSFIGNEDFTLKTNNTTKNWDGTLEYSTDASTWNTWNGTEISSAGCKLYLRGTGNTYISDMSCQFVFTGTEALKISCEGNIESLLDYITVKNGEHPIMDALCYFDMFYNCTSLIKAPELPAVTLTDGCYKSMFSGCTSLTTAPELPATTLASRCYSSMFNGCTSLTTAPNLPATTLASQCYQSMFKGCTSLTSTPELPAIKLAKKCYSYMFENCTSLTTAPALPATTLADNCYEYMFNICTSLTSAPELPATTLATQCYMYMFAGCTSLTTTSGLPATTLADDCYYYMFTDCTSITTLPALPATILITGCYYSMFYNCSNIKLSTTQTGEYQTAYRIPTSGTGTTGTHSLDYMFNNTGGTFTDTPEINTTYYTSNTVV